VVRSGRGRGRVRIQTTRRRIATGEWTFEQAVACLVERG